MSVGPFYDADRLRWRAAQLATRREQLEADTRDFHAYIAAENQAGRLTEAGFTYDDAVEYARLADVMGTLSALYYGVAGQEGPYDFHDALTAWRGPGIAT